MVSVPFCRNQHGIQVESRENQSRFRLTYMESRLLLKMGCDPKLQGFSEKVKALICGKVAVSYLFFFCLYRLYISISL